MTRVPAIDGARLLERLRTLGAIGRTPDGALARVALSDADRAGRDQLVAWMREAGLRVDVDAIGNIFGTWGGPSTTATQAPTDRSTAAALAPVMIGSHVDSVVDAGIYDGSLGVLAGLAAVEALRDAGVTLPRAVTVAAFTNEEGVRYMPDMLGSLVHAGGLALEAALALTGTDGSVVGDELRRIGYAGAMVPGTIRPHAYIELHIEQGPILEEAGDRIGAVENLQGISWQRLVIVGQANHAGTTPMRLRRDAGHAAARVTTFVHDLAERSQGTTVATVGSLVLEPGVINVIPGRATLTVDLRDADESRLASAEASLATFLATLAAEAGVTIDVERLVRLAPVTFDPAIVAAIEAEATARGHRVRRMTSGAGHDAQMIARIAPAAMIFVPSVGGISHNPRERTSDADVVAGAEVVLGVVVRLAGT